LGEIGIKMVEISGPLRILYLASEAEPFVKVGGLGDVAGSLPRAIRRLSLARSEKPEDAVDIRIVIPFHGEVASSKGDYRIVASYNVQTKEELIPVKIFDTQVEGVPVYLVSGAPIDSTGPVYSSEAYKDGQKYIFFSLAALELARYLGFRPDILHVNDWHTAPAVYALSTLLKQDPFFQNTASLLTIHNLPYLGTGTEDAMEAFGLPAASNSRLPSWAQKLPLPTGLLTADHIVTVSPTYAVEILTPEFGSGLDKFLLEKKNAISGILNGLDLQLWDPSADTRLPVNFRMGDISGRDANKTALQLEIGLDHDPRRMLIGMVTRMDNQKGVDLALDALEILGQSQEESSHQSWQVVILGSGSPALEEAAQQTEAKFPDQMKAILRYDPSLSRMIYGGCDTLLIPSRYEPCGLAQMIAMRYGCVPIGRATGGLKDTIRDIQVGEEATGFLFEEPTPQALASAIKKALHSFTRKDLWRKIQHNGMECDFSWERSAGEYINLYQSLISKKLNNPNNGQDLQVTL
jgi:starch synthase